MKLTKPLLYMSLCGLVAAGLAACGDGSAFEVAPVPAPEITPTPTIEGVVLDGHSDAKARVPDAPSAPPDEQIVKPLDLQPVCTTLAQASCRIHLGCRAGVTNASLEACHEHVRGACELALPEVSQRIEDGRVAFSESALRACSARLDMLACDAPGAMIEAVGDACDAVFQGAVGRGRACGDAGDCLAGLACVAGPGGSCPGRCELPGVLGADCSELAPCAAGLLCDGGQCVSPEVALHASCIATEQCPTGAYCADRDGFETCEPRLALGARCDDDDACPEDGYCKRLLDDVPGACAARLTLGASCDPLTDACALGLACDEQELVCRLPPNEAGDGCLADASPCGVGTGLVCDAGLCELEPMLGDDCDADRPCRFGTCLAGTCEDYLLAGASCERDIDCGALFCRGAEGARTCGLRTDTCHADVHDINLGLRMRVR